MNETVADVLVDDATHLSGRVRIRVERAHGDANGAVALRWLPAKFVGNTMHAAVGSVVCDGSLCIVSGAGRVLDLTLRWTLPPVCATDHDLGVRDATCGEGRYGTAEGVLTLGNFLPAEIASPSRLPGYTRGDVMQAERGVWRVHIDAPAELQWFTNASSARATEVGVRRHWQFRTVARDLSAVAGVGYRTVALPGAGNGVLALRSPDPRCPDEAVAARIQSAYGWYSDTLWRRDSTGLTVVEVPRLFARATEYDGMYIFDRGACDAITVGHEVAHQWFGADLASDEMSEPWIDEGLAMWADYSWLHATDPTWTAGAVVANVRAAFAAANGDVPGDLPIGEYPDIATRQFAVYVKSSIFFERTRQAMGPAFVPWLAMRRGRRLVAGAELIGSADAGAPARFAHDVHELHAADDLIEPDWQWGASGR